MNYKRLLIQQYTQNGSTTTNVGGVVDTQSAYNVVCQEFPFKHLPETKDLPSRDWYDNDGEDVYIPTDGLKFKAYDLEAKFLYVGYGYKRESVIVPKEDEMRQKIGSFIDFLYGRNENGSPLLMVYDEYTKTGRRGIYVKDYDNELLAYDDRNDNVIGIFKVKFRVTDPVYNVAHIVVDGKDSLG